MASYFALPAMSPEMETRFRVTRWQDDQPYPQDVYNRVVMDMEQIVKRIDNDKVRSEIYGILEHMKQKILSLNNVDRQTQMRWMEEAHHSIDKLRQEYEILKKSIGGQQREGYYRRWGWGGNYYYPWYSWTSYNPYVWYYYRPYYWNFA